MWLSMRMLVTLGLPGHSRLDQHAEHPIDEPRETLPHRHDDEGGSATYPRTELDVSPGIRCTLRIAIHQAGVRENPL